MTREPSPNRRPWVAALLTAGAVGLTLLRRFEISETSMSPTLRPGDYVIAYRSNRPPRRGDIVVFEHPHRPSYFLVKRVVGLPGETIEFVDGEVVVDGLPLDEPWAADQTGPEMAWKLEPGEALVLGDSRWLSAGDSREIGPLPIGALRLRAIFRYWPADRIGSLLPRPGRSTRGSRRS